jgi:hypothetical protein
MASRTLHVRLRGKDQDELSYGNRLKMSVMIEAGCRIIKKCREI